MIIGLGGYAGTGKDTIGQEICKHYGYRQQAFADPIRESLLKLDPDLLWIDECNDTEILSLASQHNIGGWDLIKNDFPDEYRKYMQRIGTELGRDIHGEECWINIAMKRMLAEDPEGERTVFTDVRFQNEINMIMALGGTCVYLTREGVERPNDHASATQELVFPHTYENDGTPWQVAKGIFDMINAPVGIPA